MNEALINIMLVGAFVTVHEAEKIRRAQLRVIDVVCQSSAHLKPHRFCSLHRRIEDELTLDTT